MLNPNRAFRLHIDGITEAVENCLRSNNDDFSEIRKALCQIETKFLEKFES